MSPLLLMKKVFLLCINERNSLSPSTPPSPERLSPLFDPACTLTTLRCAKAVKKDHVDGAKWYRTQTTIGPYDENLMTPKYRSRPSSN